MRGRKLLLILLLSLLCAEACHQGRRQLDLTSVRASDLRKLNEEVQRGASVEGLNQVVGRVPSPDGKRIAYSERMGGAGLESLRYGIYVSDTTERERIKIAEVVNYYGLAWSPDGTKIAFSEGTIVYIADSDGMTKQAVHVGPGGPYPGACFNLTWSEGGQKLSFVQVENARDADLANPSKVVITLGTATRESVFRNAELA
jgi:Tol biopolymer transport system component